jgi:hypothetical protein
MTFSDLFYVSLWGRSFLSVEILYAAADIVSLSQDKTRKPAFSAFLPLPLPPFYTSNPSKYSDVGSRGFRSSRSSAFICVTLKKSTECIFPVMTGFRLC